MKHVDASLLVDYARGDDAAIAFLTAHDGDVIGASTIVLSKFYRGLMLTQEMTREEPTSKYEWVDAVPFTNETAVEAADIVVELRSEGAMINKSDIYIAGTTRSLDIPLVVGDDHFDAIEELAVETDRA